MVKILLGGSPCTYWSISKTTGRETAASGTGWELFLNYKIAKEKFNPDFFLYENNWSASTEIKDQIQHELNCDLFRINSSLVSAQSRDRFYVCNWRNSLPEDRGILLKDILVTSDKNSGPYYELGLPVLSHKEMAYMVRKTKDGRNHFDFGHYHNVLSGKSSCVTANTAKGVPYNVLCEPIRIGTIKNSAKNQAKHNSKQYRVYSADGKSTTLCGEGGGVGAKTGLYAVPKCAEDQFPYYKVRNGKILVDEEWYPVRLQDGDYIIRKLLPVEAERLQTMPDGYTAAVSDTQRLRGLGNGWTAEVIIHLLSAALKDVPRTEKLLVFSMYDGIGTGRYCLQKMGFNNVEYHAYEIDKYAMKVASSNYPDIIYHGDAFKIRNENERWWD